MLDELLDAFGESFVHPHATGALAARRRVDADTVRVAEARPCVLDDPFDPVHGHRAPPVALCVAAGHTEVQRAIVALGTAGHANAAVPGLAASSVGVATIWRRRAFRHANVRPAVFAEGAARRARADPALAAGTVSRRIAQPELVHTFVAALTEASVSMLTLLARGTAVSLAAQDRYDAGNALSFDATQSLFAVASGFAFRFVFARVGTAVLMLALLSNRTSIALATKDRRESGNALAVETAETGFAIARRAAFALGRALPLATVLVLAESTCGAAIALAAENLQDLGDATAVAACQARLAITGRAAFAFLLAQVTAAIAVLAFLPGRTGIAVATVDGCEAGQTLPFETSIARLAIASRMTLATGRRNTNLCGTVPASRAARYAGALVSGGALDAVFTTTRRYRSRAHRFRSRVDRILRHRR